MNTLIVFLLATNAILICISGYYLTARIYPTLFSTTDITGKNPLKNLENAIADIDTASQDTTRLSKTAADAFSHIYNAFSDIQTGLGDSVARARRGIALLILSVLIQIAIAFLQIFFQ